MLVCPCIKCLDQTQTATPKSGQSQPHAWYVIQTGEHHSPGSYSNELFLSMTLGCISILYNGVIISISGFLILGIIGILNQIILCRGDFPIHFGMLATFLASIHQLLAGPTSLVMTSKNVARLPDFLWGKINLLETMDPYKRVIYGCTTLSNIKITGKTPITLCCCSVKVFCNILLQETHSVDFSLRSKALGKQKSVRTEMCSYETYPQKSIFDFF